MAPAVGFLMEQATNHAQKENHVSRTITPRSSTGRHRGGAEKQPPPNDGQEQPSTEAGIPEEPVSQLEETESGEQPSYPNRAKFYVAFASLNLAILCVGLDRSILSTAIPKITSEFNSLPDVGWYGSAFLLTTCCFQLLFGKLYAEFPVKRTYLAALVIFEVGSVVCAAAPNSLALIVGRAVAGIGCAGLQTGSLIIINYIVPVHKRPKWIGIIGGTIGIAQVLAPTLGGVFTDKVTWRWCFWINLPLGGVTILVVLFFIHIPNQRVSNTTGWAGFLDKFDYIGTVILIPWVICLVLAVEWGNVEYPWSNWRVILLLVLFGVLFVIWLGVQYLEGDKATCPPRLMKDRTMIAANTFMFCLYSSFFVVTYYVPIWFQSVKSVSAFDSGIDFLSTSASMSVAVIGAGLITTKIGYLNPNMYAGVVLSSVGAGLLYTFDSGTTTVYWAASLVLVGLGLGLGGQQPQVAIQTTFHGADISLATSVVTFVQSLGGSVILAIAQSIFDSHLVSSIERLAPGVDPQDVIKAGASDLRGSMEKLYPRQVDQILLAYNEAIRKVFLMALILSCLSAIGAALMKWRKIQAAPIKDRTSGGNKEESNNSLAS